MSIKDVSGRPTGRQHALFAILLSGVSAAAIGVATARADTAASSTVAADATPVVQEVVITAERQATSLKRTPLSVGVVGAQDVQDRNLQSLRDIDGSVAGLQIPAAATPSLSYVFVRGIGTTSPTYNGAVGIYDDDVYVARVINSGVFGLPDIERLEVLRGPQGTLYGENTSGGALRVISRTPTDQPVGWAAVSGGDYGQFEARGYIAGPIKEGVLDASLAYSHQQNGGYTYDVTLNKNVNRILTDQARLKLRFIPPSLPRLETVLTVQGLIDHSDNSVLSPLNVPNPKPNVTYENLDLAVNNRNILTSLVSDYRLDDHLTVKSITGYRAFHNSPDPWSQDGLATNLFEWQLNLDQRQVSQEFQVLGNYQRLTFTGGVIGYQELFNVNRPNITLGAPGGIRSKTLDTNGGVYGQLHYKITSALGLTAGLRYSADEQSYGNTGYNSTLQFQYVSTKYSVSGLKQNTNAVTPKIGLDYQVNPNLFVYGSVTKGEKEGGYNPVAGSLVIAEVPILPEEVTTYETGVKSTLFQGAVQANASVFYNDFKNYQSILSNVYYNGTLVNGSVAINAQKAVTSGVEFEVTARPIEAVELGVNGTLMDAHFAKFTQLTSSGLLTYTGNRLPYTSKFSIGAHAVYTLPLKTYGTFRLRANWKYASDSYGDITNITKIPSYSITDLEAYYTTPDNKWTGFVSVRNVFNRVYAYSGIPTAQLIPGVLAAAFSPPRMFQVGIRRDFF
jgi:iron complex outermembrane receptor protein